MGDAESVFALDIGTRTVVGVVIEKDKTGITVRAARMLEHETRAMYDGQIHDVEAVAGVIKQIKKELEEELGRPLTRAAVAAAGRALRTSTARVERVRDQYREFTTEEIHTLELEAVQQAQADIAARNDENRAPAGEYFCVGYSVVNYYLEGQAIGNLVGQVGHRAAVEVIATFLPRVVVDSLFSALRRAGLELYSLTLEPIAAMSVAVPPRMRLLNLALVDIGAGTSDIALVKRGSIVAYAMVPVGGDEITESVAEKYLLDFNTAETVKCQLAGSDTVSCEDILGNPVCVPSAEVVNSIKEMVRDLAVKVAREILVLNQKAPDAVLCVGGGSLTPGLLEELAAAMELPRNRVGLRTREAITEIQGDFQELSGPQGVTPLGIGFKALEGRPLPFIRVLVNQREIPVWSLNETTVATALLSAGVGLKELYGKPGMGLTVEINGSLHTIKGELGGAPTIRLDGKETSLDAPVYEGAVIEYFAGKDGRPAECTVGQLIPDLSGEVYVNNQRLVVKSQVLMNDQPVDMKQPVPDRARIEYAPQNTMGRILAAAGVGEELLQETVFNYRLNGQPVVLRWSPCEATVEGKTVGMDYPVPFGSKVEYRLKAAVPQIKDVLPSKEETSLTVTVNGREVIMPYRKISIQVNNRPASPEDTLTNGAEIWVMGSEEGAILSDVLGHIEISPVGAGQLVLKVDGKKAGFTTPIHNGSKVEIYWED